MLGSPLALPSGSPGLSRQQLAITAWNVAFALVLIVWAFGWSGGKLLVGQSYTGAKVKVEEQKTRRAAAQATKRAARRSRTP